MRLNGIVSQVSTGRSQRCQVLDRVAAACVEGCDDLARAMRAFPLCQLLLGADIRQWRGIDAIPQPMMFGSSIRRTWGGAWSSSAPPPCAGVSYGPTVWQPEALRIMAITLATAHRNKAAVARFMERATNVCCLLLAVCQLPQHHACV